MRKKNQTQLTAVAGRKVRNQPLGYLFLLPVMASLTIFTFYPFFRSIYLTFFMADRLGNAKKFVGFGNYIRLWQSGAIQETIGDTLSGSSFGLPVRGSGEGQPWLPDHVLPASGTGHRAYRRCGRLHFRL